MVCYAAFDSHFDVVVVLYCVFELRQGVIDPLCDFPSRILRVRRFDQSAGNFRGVLSRYRSITPVSHPESCCCVVLVIYINVRLRLRPCFEPRSKRDIDTSHLADLDISPDGRIQDGVVALR